MPCSCAPPPVGRLISTPAHGFRDAPLLWICHHSGSPHTAFQTCEGIPIMIRLTPSPTELLLDDLTRERENQGTKEQQTRAAFPSQAFRKIKAIFRKFISSRESFENQVGFCLHAFVCCQEGVAMPCSLITCNGNAATDQTRFYSDCFMTVHSCKTAPHCKSICQLGWITDSVRQGTTKQIK